MLCTIKFQRPDIEIDFNLDAFSISGDNGTDSTIPIPLNADESVLSSMSEIIVVHFGLLLPLGY